MGVRESKKSLSVAVGGPLIVDDLDPVIRAALDDVGLAYMAEVNAMPHLASSGLVRVVED
jgi:DNA-binding transcriptional LysR family regulator